MLAGGCSDLLDVDLPGVVEAKTLENPEISALLVESAIADFECAYTNYSAGSSAMSDEWWHTSGGQVYRDLYEAINLANRQHYWFTSGGDLYDEPRRIRFGVKVGL